jgi:hypothetical protein
VHCLTPVDAQHRQHESRHGSDCLQAWEWAAEAWKQPPPNRNHSPGCLSECLYAWTAEQCISLDSLHCACEADGSAHTLPSAASDIHSDIQDEGLRLLHSKAEIIDELEATLPKWVRAATWYPAFVHILKIHPDSTYEVREGLGGSSSKRRVSV